MDKGIFSYKKGEVGKVIEEFLHRETKLCLFLIFVFINPANVTILGMYKSNNF